MPGGQLDVVCIGELLVDMIPVGEMLYKACFGGAPMNCAVGCARLGLRVGALAAVGDDAFGRFLIGVLRDRGVDASRVKIVRGRRTTLAFVVKLGKEREYFFYRKPWAPTADTELVLGEEDLEYALGARLVHVSGFALSQEPARSSVLGLMRRAKSRGVIVSFDPTFRRDVWPDLAEAAEVYEEALRYVDLFLATANECRLLLGTDDARELSRRFRLVGIKMGDRGALLTDGRETYRMRAYDVEVKDTVGAGDAWNAAVIFGVLRGLPLKEALRLANAVASIKCMHVGAISGLPTYEEALAFIRAHPEVEPELVARGRAAPRL